MKPDVIFAACVLGPALVLVAWILVKVAQRALARRKRLRTPQTYAMGFRESPRTLEAGETFTFHTTLALTSHPPGTHFCARRLIIPSNVAPQLEVVDMMSESVRGYFTKVFAVPVPAAYFTELVIGRESFHPPPIPQGGEVKLVLRNVSALPAEHVMPTLLGMTQPPDVPVKRPFWS